MLTAEFLNERYPNSSIVFKFLELSRIDNIADVTGDHIFSVCSSAGPRWYSKLPPIDNAEQRWHIAAFDGDGLIPDVVGRLIIQSARPHQREHGCDIFPAGEREWLTSRVISVTCAGTKKARVETGGWRGWTASRERSPRKSQPLIKLTRWQSHHAHSAGVKHLCGARCAGTMIGPLDDAAARRSGRALRDELGGPRIQKPALVHVGEKSDGPSALVLGSPGFLGRCPRLV